MYCKKLTKIKLLPAYANYSGLSFSFPKGMGLKTLRLMIKNKMAEMLIKNSNYSLLVWGGRKSPSLSVTVFPPMQPKVCQLNSLNFMFHLKIRGLK